jgi:hypothetical protein
MRLCEAIRGAVDRDLTARGRACRMRLAFLGFEVAVEAADAAIAAELEDRLAPFAEVRAEQPASRAPSLLLRVGRGDPPAVPARGDVVELRPAMGSVALLAEHHAGGPAHVVRDALSGTSFAFVQDEPVVHAVGPSPDVTARDCRRLLQDLFRIHARRRGIPSVEAAALVSAGGVGALLVGPPRAGKTSLLLRLLAGRTGVFVANDEVFLDAATTPPTAHGSPIHVAVRREVAARHVQLADLSARMAVTGAEKETMTFRRFAERLCVPVGVRCAVDVLLAPGPGDGVRRMEPGEAAVRLAAVEGWTESWRTPWRLITWMVTDEPGAPDPGWAAAIARRVRAHHIGWHAPEPHLLALFGAGA